MIQLTDAKDLSLYSRRGGRVRRHLAALGIRPAKLPKGAMRVEEKEIAENPILKRGRGHDPEAG